MALVWRDQLDENGDPTGNEIADSASTASRQANDDYVVDKVSSPRQVIKGDRLLTGDPAIFGRAAPLIFFHDDASAKAYAEVVEIEATTAQGRGGR